MDYFGELQHQIGILLILCLTGIVIGKARLLQSDTGDYLFKLVINATMPALIISSMANIHFTAADFFEGMIIIIATFFFLTVSFLIAWLTAKCLNLPHSQSMVFRMAVVFGHTTGLGFPLLLTIFGEEIVKHAIFYILTQDIIYWIAGVYLIANHNVKDKLGNIGLKSRLQKLFNPNTVAYVTGIVLALCNVSENIAGMPVVGGLYDLVISALSALGGVTLSIVMIAIGLLMSEKITFLKLRSIKGLKNALVAALIKLVVMPTMAYLFLYPMRDIIDTQVYLIIVIQLAMPCGVFISALAVQYEQDYYLASDSIFLSTLFSLCTIPIVFGILF